MTDGENQFPDYVNLPQKAKKNLISESIEENTLTDLVARFERGALFNSFLYKVQLIYKQ